MNFPSEWTSLQEMRADQACKEAGLTEDEVQRVICWIRPSSNYLRFMAILEGYHANGMLPGHGAYHFTERWLNSRECRERAGAGIYTR